MNIVITDYTFPDLALEQSIIEKAGHTLTEKASTEPLSVGDSPPAIDRSRRPLPDGPDEIHRRGHTAAVWADRCHWALAAGSADHYPTRACFLDEPR